jgi:glycerol uptake facilitator protein
MDPYVAEFFGTMMLILLGDGVVAGVVLKKSKAENGGWIVITAGWGFAVMCGIIVAKSLGGPGFLNPIGPICEWANNSMSQEPALRLIGAQFAGAFVGAVMVWLHYLPHWSATDDPDTKRAVFCTAPAIRNWPCNMISEIIGTFVLVFVASAMGKIYVDGNLQFPLIGTLVWAIGLSLGGTTGYAINPARDLGPRIAHFLLPIPGKGSSDWGYAWIPVVGPIIGGLSAVGVLRFITSASG